MSISSWAFPLVIRVSRNSAPAPHLTLGVLVPEPCQTLSRPSQDSLPDVLQTQPLLVRLQRNHRRDYFSGELSDSPMPGLVDAWVMTMRRLEIRPMDRFSGFEQFGEVFGRRATSWKTRQWNPSP